MLCRHQWCSQSPVFGRLVADSSNSLLPWLVFVNCFRMQQFWVPFMRPKFLFAVYFVFRALPCTKSVIVEKVRGPFGSAKRNCRFCLWFPRKNLSYSRFLKRPTFLHENHGVMLKEMYEINSISFGRHVVLLGFFLYLVGGCCCGVILGICPAEQCHFTGNLFQWGDWGMSLCVFEKTNVIFIVDLVYLRS